MNYGTTTRLYDAGKEMKAVDRHVVDTQEYLHQLVLIQGIKVTNQAYVDAYEDHNAAILAMEEILMRNDVRKYKERLLKNNKQFGIMGDNNAADGKQQQQRPRQRKRSDGSRRIQRQ